MGSFGHQHLWWVSGELGTPYLTEQRLVEVDREAHRGRTPSQALQSLGFDVDLGEAARDVVRLVVCGAQTAEGLVDGLSNRRHSIQSSVVWGPGVLKINSAFA